MRKPLKKLEPGLPARWYHDTAHYERELEAFWYGRWIAAAREEEIPRPGDWRVVADVRANWKLVCEKFSDCFHCPPVHPELCRVVTAYRQAGAWGLKEEFSNGPEFKAGAQPLTMDGLSKIPSFENLSDEERKAIYVPAMLPPNLFLNVQPDYVNSHLVFPTGPQSVRIVYDWLFEPAHLPKGADLEHYTALWELTNAQDARNCEWQQQGIHSREFRNGVYVPQEFDCHRFAQWVRSGIKRR